MRTTAASLVTVIVGGLFAMLGGASPAAASETGFYVKRDSVVVKYEGCRNHALAYSVPASIADSYDWSIEVTVFDPTGTESDFDYLYSGADPATGNAHLYLCSFERAGSYRIEAELNYYDFYEDVDAYDHSTDTFKVRKPFTRTGVAVNDATARYGQKLTFTVTSKKEYPKGYFANRYQRVILQKYVGGRWRKIAARDTNGYGRARVVVVWKHRVKVPVRAVTRSTYEFKGSVSRNRPIW